MADNELGMIHGSACAARRLAEALLRSLGHTQVTLRLPDPSSGDNKSQLGLEPPTAEDVQISPARVEELETTTDGRRQIEVVISVTALEPIAKAYGVEDIREWLLGFEGIVQGEQLMRIVAVKVDRFLGADCLFHLTATE